MSSTDLENVASHSWRAGTLPLDVELAKQHEENVFTTDYYEILRVGPQADEETIERVYRTLADRFHPDNPGTGDPETFLRLGEAWETLSNPAKRAKYNVLRQRNRDSARFWLRGREFFDGVRGGQNRRLAVLCLLYRQRISAPDSPGLTILDLERLTGCTREEITSALWYLSEKEWGKIADSSACSITADGFDVVESQLEERLEFRSLATVCYYGLPAEQKDREHVEFRFWRDTLPLYLEPGREIEGGVSIADHYEILGIGPKADEEVIERVYRTLAGRFHPDNPSTGDANTFLRVTEAYNILSDQRERARYDALREHTRYSGRFRLRGRDFFYGIKGEQLRRLAVLCLLYRQAVSEWPGLTVLDLEQLTGCTREELTSALWYLREKKWAKYGEYTQYSITVAGFDIVENAAQTAAQNQQNAAVTIQSPVSNTIAPENRNSHWIAESGRTDIKAEEPSANAEAGQEPIPIEEAPGFAEQGTRFEVGAEPAAQSQQNVAGTPQYPVSNATIAPENCDSQRMAESEHTDVKYKILLSHLSPRYRTPPSPPGNCTSQGMAENEWASIKPDELSANVEVARGPAPFEEVPVLAEQVTRFEVGAEPPAQRRQNVAVAIQSPISNPIVPENRNSHRIAETEQTDIKAEEPSDQQLAVATGLAQIEDAPGIPEQVTRLEDGAEPEEREADRSWAWLCPEDAYRNGFEYPHEASATQAVEQSLKNVAVALQSPISNTIVPENRNSHRIAEAEQTDIKAEEPSDEQLAVAPGLAQINEASGIPEQVTRLEDGAEPEEREADRSWAWLCPEDAYGNGFEYPHEASATQAAAQRRQNVAVALQSPISNTTAPENRNSHRIAETEQTDIKAEEPSDEQLAVAPGLAQINEASGIPEQVTRLEDGAEREEREADRSWAWLCPEDAYGNGFEYPHEASATQAAEQSLKNIAVALQSPISNTIAPENRNSHRIAEAEQTDIKAEEPSDQQLAVAPGPARIEDAPGPAEQGSQFEDGAAAQEREAAISRARLAPDDTRGNESVSPQASAAQTAARQPNVKVPPQSPGVIMINSKTMIAEQAGGVAVSAGKRVILSMGGKGGVGKTSVMTGLAEWFGENRIPVTMLDLDLENKACGSLTHFFGGRVPKINIHTPAGLDAFVDNLAEDAPVILADMGAGAGRITHDWFEKMYPDVAEAGVAFTAIGVVTSDPASVESVLNWAAALQDRVSYVIVMNNLTEHADFTYWWESDQAQEFRKRFQPAIVRLDYRLADLENAVRNYGVTLGQVANRTVSAPELQKASLVMRAQSYRRRMFAEFDNVKELLLP